MFHGLFISPVVSVCQLSHPSGNDTCGWQHSVFPLKINCGARYSPVVEAANTAVIWRLLSDLAIGIIFSPARCAWSILQLVQEGELFDPSLLQVCLKCHSWALELWCQQEIPLEAPQNVWPKFFLSIRAFLFTYPILFNRDFAQGLVMCMWAKLREVSCQHNSHSCCHDNSRVHNSSYRFRGFNVLLYCLVQFWAKK